MAELRWILLAVGVGVILGIWIWGRFMAYRTARAERAAAAAALQAELGYSEAEPADGDTPFGPASRDAVPFDPDSEFAETTVLPPVAAQDRRLVPQDPPIITIQDLPDDMDSVELSSSRTAGPSIPVIEPLRPTPPTLEKAVTPPPRPTPKPAMAPARNAMPWPPPGATPAAPPPRATVVEPPVVAAPVSAPLPTPPPPANDPPPAAEAETKSDRLQRILAVRLVMLSGRLASGEQLAQAFRAERLEYGRYRIFHRMADGERPIFSVASLVEPGSFDPDLMVTERYLGVSMFAVFPGPIPAPQAFDELIATGRRLADRLGAVLQDDTGHSLTGQRLLALREELVSFESLVSMARTGRRPS
jgi:cell division protein ZipA